MTNNCAEVSDVFWNTLFHLEELRVPTKLSEFLSEHEIEKDTFFIFLEQAHYFGLTVNLQEEGEGYKILPLSWHKEFGDLIIQKSFYRELAADLQNCIETSRCCSLTYKNDSQMEILPWRLLFLDNSLTLIGEDVKTKRLLTIEIDEISEMEVRGSDYRSFFSRLEVEDFINAMRLVAGSDERLVIKIQYGSEISMPSELIFLGNPYTTTNQYGDVIWAASVEKSDYLYEWLFSIRDKIDILDPTSIKDEFEYFCNMRNAA